MRGVIRQPQLSEHAQRLGGEGLIQLNQIHIVYVQPGALQHFMYRRYRSEPHQLRLDARRRHRHNSRPRRQPLGGGLPRAGDNQRRGAVVDARGVSRGHHATFPERRFQPRELFKGGVRPRMLVVTHDVYRPFPVDNRYRHDLLRQNAVALGLGRTLLTTVRKSVLIVAADI